ncbi:MAG: hypothetical protein IMF18_13670, partial [Proteobacteria bacterium]|nr:hypothetical protein [Pseudomonadota bacterium]
SARQTAGKKNGGPARHKSGGQAYIPNNLRWAGFSKTKIGSKLLDFVAVTDNDWFAFLSHQPGIDEINFWQPNGTAQFRKKGIRPSFLVYPF